MYSKPTMFISGKINTVSKTNDDRKGLPPANRAIAPEINVESTICPFALRLRNGKRLAAMKRINAVRASAKLRFNGFFLRQ